jgi:lysophospholipid acyltransferase (LPLAT)-like uncharacterized protein
VTAEGPSTPLGTGWRASRSKRVQASAIAAAGYPVLNALGRTLRWHVEGTKHLDAVTAAGHRPIFAFWHGRILHGTLFFQRRGIIVITSENFDGEWIARIIHRFGFGTARGSTSRGAMGAMRQLMKQMASGRPTAFTVDGPRGPARIAQPGAVWLAKATGNPVVPFHAESSRHWTLGSWDRTQIPKPFATATMAIGEPLYVARQADDEAVERARGELEIRLAALEARATSLLHNPPGG